MSDAIADALDAGDVCTAAGRADELLEATTTAINNGQVPQEFQEDLQARANELVNTVNCPPPPTTTEQNEGGAAARRRDTRRAAATIRARARTPSRCRRRPDGHGRDPVSTETIAQGRYRVERPLGNGAMANVVLAHDEELGGLSRSSSWTSSLRPPATSARASRARAALQRASHTRTSSRSSTQAKWEAVRTSSWSTSTARRSRSCPATRSTSIDEVRTIAQQVAAGLEHAHSHGLVHRDLKPGNLIQRSDGTVKIADFGIACGSRMAPSTLLRPAPSSEPLPTSPWSKQRAAASRRPPTSMRSASCSTSS